MRTLRLVLFSLLLVEPAARAGEPSAAQLFTEGVKLFNRGEVDAACSKFEASYGLADQAGTLFNLAACHEKQGRYFEAHAEFSKLADRMQVAGKTDKAAIAKRRAEQAGTHAPKLELVFPASSKVTRVELDGKSLPTGEWKQPILVAAGSHQLVFSAANKESSSTSVTAENDKSTHVEVPELDDPQSAPAPPSTPARAGQQSARDEVRAPGGKQAGAAPVELGWSPTSAAARDHAPSFWTHERTIGAALSGVGVVGLGVGSVYGLRALSQKSDADDACGGSGGACPSSARTDDAKARIRSAQTSATVSTVGFAAGAVCLAAGAYLIFKGGKPAEASVARSAVRVVPAGPGDAGISVLGGF